MDQRCNKNALHGNLTFFNEKVSYDEDRDVWKVATQCIFVGPLVHCSLQTGNLLLTDNSLLFVCLFVFIKIEL